MKFNKFIVYYHDCCYLIKVYYKLLFRIEIASSLKSYNNKFSNCLKLIYYTLLFDIYKLINNLRNRIKLLKLSCVISFL